MDMRALALDFDGVISDSARESFAVALRAYGRLRENDPFASADRDALYTTFLSWMPLGNRAEDYGATLCGLDRGAPTPADQGAYDAFKATLDAEWLERYHTTFYEVRSEWAERAPESWQSLMRPYPGILELLRRRAAAQSYAVATSKDGASVRRLLGAYGVRDLFPEELLLDKEAGPRKSEHLETIARRLGLEPSTVTFVDDKVNHLDTVAPLGVRCVLAAWGYNGPREHALARSRGYLVCTLDDLESRLWG